MVNANWTLYFNFHTQMRIHAEIEKWRTYYRNDEHFV